MLIANIVATYNSAMGIKKSATFADNFYIDGNVIVGTALPYVYVKEYVHS